MTKEELLDHFATQAMIAILTVEPLRDRSIIAQTAYRMAQDMLEVRYRIHREWAEEEKRQERYKTADLEELNLPIRYFRCLQAENILSKEELCAWTERDLRRIPNLGMKGIQFIKQALAMSGLKLKEQN
jgi:DNA-directed RNA polymerase alpha subunit